MLYIQKEQPLYFTVGGEESWAEQVQGFFVMKQTERSVIVFSSERFELLNAAVFVGQLLC